MQLTNLLLAGVVVCDVVCLDAIILIVVLRFDLVKTAYTHVPAGL
jgi:hypothetical protein